MWQLWAAVGALFVPLSVNDHPLQDSEASVSLLLMQLNLPMYVWPPAVGIDYG